MYILEIYINLLLDSEPKKNEELVTDKINPVMVLRPSRILLYYSF